MHRFFVDETGIQNGAACIEASDARHLRQVLRLAPGDDVVLMDGKSLYSAVLKAFEGERVHCAVKEELPSPEAKLRITLYQGLPKLDKLEWIIQKCTEAGTAGIVPVALTRCVMKVPATDAQLRQERWQRIAREAAKQSGRAVVPDVALPTSLDKVIDRLKGHELVLVPWEEAGAFGPAGVCRQFSHVRDIAIVIGPEGGIAPEEVGKLQKEANAIPMTLGKRILRTETAGLAAAVAMLALWGEME